MKESGENTDLQESKSVSGCVGEARRSGASVLWGMSGCGGACDDNGGMDEKSGRGLGHQQQLPRSPTHLGLSLFLMMNNRLVM